MDQIAELKDAITAWRGSRLQAQRRWSAIHHFTLFGSIVFSILAGAQIQLFDNPGAATIFTSLAAALTGIAASGGFERKWRSNRLSRSRADCMLIDLEADEPEIDILRQRFKAAIERHDLDIVGDKI